MSRLLLDTQVALWWDIRSPRLGKKAAAAIRSAREVYVSAASEWEITIKAHVGKVTLPRTIEAAATDAGFRLLPISFAHAQGVGALAPLHRDPFDRLLVSAARAEALTFVTADEILFAYPVRTLDARR